MSYGPWGHKSSDMTELLTLPQFLVLMTTSSGFLIGSLSCPIALWYFQESPQKKLLTVKTLHQILLLEEQNISH